MQTYTCADCEFTFAETEKAWRDTLDTLQCQKCLNKLYDFPPDPESFKSPLNKEIQKLHISTLDKWEYQQVQDASNEVLNELGAAGWELVGIASYDVGGGLTINGLGGEKYTVHICYIFKRRSSILQKCEDINLVLDQIKKIKNEINALHEETNFNELKVPPISRPVSSE